MSEYWLGVLTIPALLAAGWLVVVAFFRALAFLERRGFMFSIRLTNHRWQNVSNYTLSHDIWWERSFGPVFVGGWYREDAVYREQTTEAHFNRWVGIGRADGPNVMVFKVHNLGRVPAKRDATTGWECA